MVWVKVPVPDVITKLLPASKVNAARVVAPSAFKVEVVEIAPSEVIAPTPVIAPAVVMSQSDESMATVFALPPIVTAPVDVPVAILTAKFEEVFKETAAPVMVSPPVPWISPVPELTPTNTPAPVDPVIDQLVPERSLAPADKAVTISASDTSRAVVNPPAAD